MPRLFTPLVTVTVPSVYENGPLPKALAKCSRDTAVALEGVIQDLRSLGHELRLSDMFRSYAMQKNAHEDYLQKRKKAYSPPPGSSMHEAGRAVDIDLSSMGVDLKRFWEIARARGFYPIIDAPEISRSEAWHFDCRGSHQGVYEYVRAGRAGAAMAPYTQMAQSAILALGVPLEKVPDQDVAFVQAGLIRLGLDPGRIDGILGVRTEAALKDAGVAGPDLAGALSQRLKEKFPSSSDVWMASSSSTNRQGGLPTTR
jgi:hypothetical protein